MSPLDSAVVVIDDEPEIVSVISETLEMEGFNVLPFTCPFVALERLKDLDIDVIICDAHMPGMGGIELLAELKGLMTKPFSFYLCTGDMQIDTKKFYELGGTKVVMKPFSIVDLAKEIKDHFS